MGPMTGLATTATLLLVLTAVGAIAVLGLTFAFVLPAVRITRTDRRTRHLSIPRYYLHPVTAH